MRIERLLRVEGPWLHVFLATESDLCDALWQLQRPGSAATLRLVPRIIRGHKARTTQALFDEFAAALQFPYYFGENWAAFDECLADLEWLPADAYLIAISNAADLLEDEPESANAFREFLERMVRIAREWSEPRHDGTGEQPPRAFHTILHCPHADEPALRRKLRAATVAHDEL
jgi:hypothetical protein